MAQETITSETCNCSPLQSCVVCCEPQELTLVDCNCDEVTHATDASPVDSLKFDGQAFDPFSVNVREFCIQLAKDVPSPVRGTGIKYGTEEYRVTEVTRYGCDVIVVGVNFRFPCPVQAKIYICQSSDYCDEDNDTNYLGEIPVVVASSGGDVKTEMAHNRNKREARIYPITPLIPCPHDNQSPKIEANRIIEVNGVQYKIEKIRNDGLVDRAPYYEAEEGSYVCS